MRTSKPRWPAFLVLLMIALTSCTQTELTAGQQDVRFSLADYQPPSDDEWVDCPISQTFFGGGISGPAGARISVPNSHVVSVGRNAVAFLNLFSTTEPAGDHLSLAVNAGPQRHFGGERINLLISWAHRDDRCRIPRDAFIARIRTDGPADSIPSVVDVSAQTIRTAEPLDSLSVFAIAR